jgi:hypothetical protein
MNFDDGDAAGADSVVECNRGVRVSGGIEDDSNEAFISRTTHASYEFTFVVGLHELDIDIFARCDCSHCVFDIGERRRAVDGGFSFSEPIEVGSGNDENTPMRSSRGRQASSLSNCGARVRSM